MTRAPPEPGPPIGIYDRLRSRYHGFWFRVSEALGRGGAPIVEVPAGDIAAKAMSADTRARLATLSRDFGVRFETTLGAKTALENYARLDLIAQAWGEESLPQGCRVHDVGSASFWYAAALHAAFHPRELVGIEVEGYRRLQGGGNRYRHARGYVQPLIATRYVVADYARWEAPADLVTAFFPFVTPGPVLAWRLPLSVLAPDRLFARIAANLSPEGELLMVNHGVEEAGVAARWATEAGLRCRLSRTEEAPLTPRTAPAVVSRWTPSRR